MKPASVRYHAGCHMTRPAVDAFPDSVQYSGERETPFWTPAMDAAEDRDLKLQRASSDLVTEFSAKLPTLLWKSQPGTPLRTPRKWAPVSKTEKLIALVRPQLNWLSKWPCLRIIANKIWTARTFSGMASASGPASAEVAANISRCVSGVSVQASRPVLLSALK